MKKEEVKYDCKHFEGHIPCKPNKMYDVQCNNCSNYEQDIEDDYLDKINSGYLEFLKNHPEFNVKIIDISDRDFVKNREDYLWVLDQICKV